MSGWHNVTEFECGCVMIIIAKEKDSYIVIADRVCAEHQEEVAQWEEIDGCS